MAADTLFFNSDDVYSRDIAFLTSFASFTGPNRVGWIFSMMTCKCQRVWRLQGRCCASPVFVEGLASLDRCHMTIAELTGDWRSLPLPHICWGDYPPHLLNSSRCPTRVLNDATLSFSRTVLHLPNHPEKWTKLLGVASHLAENS